MKKYLFLAIFLMCSPLLYADTIYFKDGTSIEGKIAKESSKFIVIIASQGANKNKACQFPREKITRVEKATFSGKPKLSPKVADKKDKGKQVKPSTKATKSAQESELRKIAKEQPAKAVKPTKETTLEKSKTKKVKPAVQKTEKPAKVVKAAKETVVEKSKVKEIKPKAQKITQPVLPKANVQEKELLKIEKKIPPRIVKPSPKITDKKEKSKEVKLPVKAITKIQESELRRIEKEKSVSQKKFKTQEKELAKIERKISQQAAKSSLPPKPTKAVESRAKEKKISFKYRLASHDVKDFMESRGMNRVESIIVVPNITDNEELKLMFSDVLEKELALTKNLDALWITAYEQGRYPDGLPKAYGIWSPPNGWYDFNNTADKSQYKWEYRFLRNEL
jgi:hypothetical protein